MSTEVRWRGGSQVQHDAFTGAQREITVNTTDWSLHVHDGATVGGHKLGMVDWNDIPPGITFAPKPFHATGTGAVDRDIYARMQEELSPLDFGAVGNGIADDTVALQNAINAGSNINLGDASRTYKISQTLDLSAGNKLIHGTGATIDMRAIPVVAAAKMGITAFGSLNAPVAVTGTTEGAQTIGCANTSGIAAGDWVHITSNDSYPYNPVAVVFMGEIREVRSVVTNTSITLSSALADTYTTSPVLRKINLVRNVHIRGIRLLGSSVADSKEQGIVFRYTFNSSVRECELIGQDHYQVAITSSLFARVSDNKFKGTYYDGTAGMIFYSIVVLNSSQWVEVTNNYSEQTRPLVVSTAASNWYGEPRYVNINGNMLHNSMAGVLNGTSFAYEQHGFGRYMTFANNIADGCYAGIRVEGARDIVLTGNIITNYAAHGIVIGGSARRTENLLISGNILRNYTGLISTTPAAFRFDGETGNTFSRVSIIGNTVYNAGGPSGVGSSLVALANTYSDCVFADNNLYAGSTVATVYAINLTSAQGFTITGNKVRNWRQGVLASSDKNVIRNNHFENSVSQSAGYGVVLAGSKNVVQANTFVFFGGTLNISSGTKNVVVDNQSYDPLAGGITGDAVTNTIRNNDFLL